MHGKVLLLAPFCHKEPAKGKKYPTNGGISSQSLLVGALLSWFFMAQESWRQQHHDLGPSLESGVLQSGFEARWWSMTAVFYLGGLSEDRQHGVVWIFAPITGQTFSLDNSRGSTANYLPQWCWVPSKTRSYPAINFISVFILTLYLYLGKVWIEKLKDVHCFC